MRNLLKKGILLIVIIIMGCNHKYITYSGEGDNWLAKQEVSQVNRSRESNILVKYKGDNLEKVKETNIKFNFTSSHGSISGEMPLNAEGVLKSSGNSCNNCYLLNESDEIVFSIEWGNGKEETFILTVN